MIVTRFAPSPTGFLHIGGARTALFNWLYARHHNGKFLLRIEDTDRERSTQAATDAIIDGMQWLGLTWDGDVVHQFVSKGRHAAVAEQLLDEGKAYHCYASQEELAALREAGKGYDRRWRDKARHEAPHGVPPVIRLKSPLEGEILVKDRVRGVVRVPAAQLEDLVILRSDGTPTYNLAVVVDDHDMGITHVIRGDDHMTNAAKQAVIYELMGWAVPEFAHVPMIHGPDGAKLSKRHGALGVEAYREMGYLPEALRNYLLRLGWSHGDDEIISTEQATEWFNLEGIGKSPSRFDFVKLENLNGHYIREADDARLVELIVPILEKQNGKTISAVAGQRLLKGMRSVKQRAKTLVELAAGAALYLKHAEEIASAARALLSQYFKSKPTAAPAFTKAVEKIRALTPSDWNRNVIETSARETAAECGAKMGDIAQPLRIAVSAATISPPIFEVMEIFGKDETLIRLKNAI